MCGDIASTNRANSYVSQIEILSELAFSQHDSGQPCFALLNLFRPADDSQSRKVSKW